MEYYHVHSRATGAEMATVQANSEEEAVYRIMGGEYGRKDFYAVSFESRRYHQEAVRRGRFVADPWERD